LFATRSCRWRDASRLASQSFPLGVKGRFGQYGGPVRPAQNHDLDLVARTGISHKTQGKRHLDAIAIGAGGYAANGLPLSENRLTPCRIRIGAGDVFFFEMQEKEFLALRHGEHRRGGVSVQKALLRPAEMIEADFMGPIFGAKVTRPAPIALFKSQAHECSAPNRTCPESLACFQEGLVELNLILLP